MGRVSLNGHGVLRFACEQAEDLDVTVSRDAKAGVRYILSSDVPGLHAEAETLDELVVVIADVTPDLIAANLPGTAVDTPVCIQHVVNTEPARAA